MVNLKFKNFLFLAIFSFIFCRSAYPQNIPNYKERALGSSSDSAPAQNDLLSISDVSVNPEEYIVGPGDEIFISISGMQDITANLIINQEGYLFIPKVGGVDLKNSNLIDAKNKIIDAINHYYKNVDVFVSLVRFRRIKVSLVGDVKNPSSYILPGNARLIDLIVNSTGLNNTSNYRDIKITGKDGNSKFYDLLRYLRFGDRKNNPLLHEGDIILVDKVDKTISISGEIKYPGTYEYIKGETAADFINLAGGFLNKARTDTIEIVRFEDNGKVQKSLYYSYKELVDNKFELENQDMIIVRQKPLYYIDRFVQVSGLVKYPGYYKIVEDKTTLTDIIDEAGGFLKDASLIDATLTRKLGTVEKDPEYERLKGMQRKDMTDDEYDYFKAKSREEKGKVVVDFVALFKKHDKSEDLILKNGDIINVPEAKDYIIMLGQVKNPGDVIYKKDLTVDDYIKLAGGFGWRAVKGDVRVIRANSGEWIEADKVVSLKPGDTIWIPEESPAPKFWDIFTTSLQILGALASIVAATVAIIVATRK